MNSGGVIQSASDSVEHVFGWTPAELFGRNVNLLIPEPRRSALDRYLDRYRHGDHTKSLQRSRRFDAVRKDGSSIQIELSVSRADLPSHSSPYFIGIIRDVSSQIDVSPNAVDERTRLQHLITEQTRALATASLRLQLADRLASLGTLAAGLGHDMNNVLLPVRAHLNALEHAGITNGAVRHLMAVRRSMAYLQKLTDGLHFLALDPDGPGAEDNDQGITNLTDWWAQVGPLLRKAVPSHVKLTAKFPEPLPLVGIAPHWLTQAVLNLIVNAGEALPPRRRNAAVQIRATLADEGHCVRIGVTDNGRGMSQATQRRALDLFFTTKPRGMGTGLGLPLANKVAIRAGGSIEITSQPARGTTVVLVLPVSTLPQPAAPEIVQKKALTVAVSIRDHRSASLVTQIVLATGARLVPAGKSGPGRADAWITDPAPRALATAARWKARNKARAVLLLGQPSKSQRARWTALGALIIESPDNIKKLREALGRVLSVNASAKPER